MTTEELMKAIEDLDEKLEEPKASGDSIRLGVKYPGDKLRGCDTLLGNTAVKTNVLSGHSDAAEWALFYDSK